MGLYLDEDTLTPAIKSIPAFVNRMVATTMRFYAPQVENSAKSNAPWTDRTTNARNGLTARAGSEGKTHYVELSHSVPYGIWLEVRFSGRNAIILPTIEEFGPRVMGTLQQILDRVGSQ